MVTGGRGCKHHYLSSWHRAIQSLTYPNKAECLTRKQQVSTFKSILSRIGFELTSLNLWVLNSWPNAWGRELSTHSTVHSDIFDLWYAMYDIWYRIWDRPKHSPNHQLCSLCYNPQAYASLMPQAPTPLNEALLNVSVNIHCERSNQTLQPAGKKRAMYTAGRVPSTSWTMASDSPGKNALRGRASGWVDIELWIQRVAFHFWVRSHVQGVWKVINESHSISG